MGIYTSMTGMSPVFHVSCTYRTQKSENHETFKSDR